MSCSNEKKTLIILNTDEGGSLLDDTNGLSTPSLLGSLIGKSTAPVPQRSGLELCIILSPFVSSSRN